MAYYNIIKRPKADGTIRYRCTVGIKAGGKHLHRETRTFSKLTLAKTWGSRRALELEEKGVPGRDEAAGVSLRELIARYIADPNLGGKAGRTKRYVLDMLADCDIARLQLPELSVAHVIEHCRERAAAGAGPVTVSQDVSYLAGVLDSAKPVYGIEYTKNPAREARPTLLHMGLVGKSNRRSRRPVGDELDRLEAALKVRSDHRSAKIPYVDILRFSILSCMRVGEVCRLRWDDIDQDARAVLVRDRKDPRKKEGNHMKVALLGEAWEIAQRQPRSNDLIFPYNSTSVSAGFQRVRDKLGIKDLRYHDMRREGASRLFEAGFSIEEVAQVTGHRSLNVLWQVYTELYPKSLHARFEELHRKAKE
ncbi:TPA: site-specific integrase [Pluralibacter gergoviae]|uniref:tyrosine-type recombinase/integrase n=1 Tax=Pluralibacter gergoviae TaxID=61647 RepID=UPI0006514C9A|nr:site-specific integrase [Pluralibacter gergoviae]KMK20930.1 integrase [Pluralibacter gergoviae]HDS1149929.1 site-specific integrase [Pluralibacter gergoviae]